MLCQKLTMSIGAAFVMDRLGTTRALAGSAANFEKIDRE